MPGQYGFYFDEDRCIGCWNCVIACKSINNLPTGIKWINLTESWEGNFPEIKRKFTVTPCLHCENPPCLEACSPGAISKRAEDGIVVVDRKKCNGCHECLKVCPYGVPQFDSNGLMQKCDFCLLAGVMPACTASCPAEALKSGPLEKLIDIASQKQKRAKVLQGKSKPALVIITRPE